MTVSETKLVVANNAGAVAKSATKPSAKPQPKAAVSRTVNKVTPKTKKTVLPKTPSNSEKTPSPVKTPKEKKIKVIRDSFTIPKAEFAVLKALKLRSAKLATPSKKIELIRAGIKALAALSDAAFIAAVRSVPSLKTGRPAKAK